MLSVLAQLFWSTSYHIRALFSNYSTWFLSFVAGFTGWIIKPVQELYYLQELCYSNFDSWRNRVSSWLVHSEPTDGHRLERLGFISSPDTKKVSFYVMSSLGCCLRRPFPFPFLCVGEVDKCILHDFSSQAQLHVFTLLHRDRYRDRALKLCSSSEQIFLPSAGTSLSEGR